MVLSTKSEQATAIRLAKGWIIREEADRVFNDPEFSDFEEIDYPFVFSTPDELNAWMSAVFEESPEEWEMTYNEFEDWRLLEMEPGDKYELYVYVNNDSMWSKHRQGFVVAI
jgi:hypothetical protein